MLRCDEVFRRGEQSRRGGVCCGSLAQIFLQFHFFLFFVAHHQHREEERLEEGGEGKEKRMGEWEGKASGQQDDRWGDCKRNGKKKKEGRNANRGNFVAEKNKKMEETFSFLFWEGSQRREKRTMCW